MKMKKMNMMIQIVNHQIIRKYLNKLPHRKEELKMLEEQIKKMDENIDAPIKFSILSIKYGG